MAVLRSPTLFFTTSPRTPFKMRAEISLLVRRFAGKKWSGNTELQSAFMRELVQLPGFEGSCTLKDPALSARDRITRAPKALGLVDLECLALTPAGRNFLDDDLAAEALLRQLLKFQLPSPYHKATERLAATFWVRPYLEILRLIHVLGRLSFDELWLFGMQLTNWRFFDGIVDKVKQFRIAKEQNKGRYKKFLGATREQVVTSIFSREIESGQLHTRESTCTSLDNFADTKVRNLRDYADACLRYLRATGLVTVSNPGKTITIIASRKDEVAYILKTVDRNPVFVDNEKAYREYLFSACVPALLTDDRDTLQRKAVDCAAAASLEEARTLDVFTLKRKIAQAQEIKKRAVVDAQITALKAFTKYDEVVRFYAEIKSKSVYDPPLSFEWNVWRTMTMIDGGDIRANLVFDDAGNPLATAPGNNADIVCDYGDFMVTVEVTLLTGNKQYDAEGEPVARHLGDLKCRTGKPVYCLFIAPKINPSIISYFFMLHKTNVKHYGGKSVVIPLALDSFVKMLTQAKNCGSIPAPQKIKDFCQYSMHIAECASDEEAWYEAISKKAENWLS